MTPQLLEAIAVVRSEPIMILIPEITPGLEEFRRRLAEGKSAARLLADTVERILVPNNGGLNHCPCRYTDPCSPGCTCMNSLSSKGCSRCCSYGSIEQKIKNAERLAALKERETWQPIETAPRDGNYVILGSELAVPHVCFQWDAEKQTWLDPDDMSWSEGVDGPTHWMNKPEDPK